jgi:hypothetical protein
MVPQKVESNLRKNLRHWVAIGSVQSLSIRRATTPACVIERVDTTTLLVGLMDGFQSLSRWKEGNGAPKRMVREGRRSLLEIGTYGLRQLH